MPIDELTAFSLIRNVFKNGVKGASESENPLEALGVIGDVTKPAVFATGIQLSESGKVREMRIASEKLSAHRMYKRDRQKNRKFESFEEVPQFQKKIIRKSTEETMVKPNVPKFGEIENPGGSLDFVYPNVHFCSCSYFRNMVLEKATDWTCSHLVATQVGKSFGKIEDVPCNTEITNVVRKIAIRPYLSSENV